MRVELFETKGLGDNSYLIISDDEVAIVDPQRDIWRFTEYIDQHNLDLKYILETHVHNDYVSGALELKDYYNHVDLALPKLGEYEFEHRGMHEGDSLKLGQSRLKVLDTPGHTYEHISWIAEQDDQPEIAFTGGSLIVGSAGRTDLLGHQHTEELTRLQYQSMQKYREFDSNLKIMPTHGQGSFCTSANPSSERTTTLEQEKQYNQALTITEEQKFIEEMVKGLLKYPSYYSHMAPINRKGPKVYGNLPDPESLTVEQFQDLMNNATVVDTRKGSSYARAHIPESYNFELASSTFSYIGWLLPFNSPMILVSDNPEQDVKELTTQLFRIGYEQVLGYLEGGIESWLDAGLPTNSYNSIPANEINQESLQNGVIIDVRDPQEVKDLSIDQAENIFLGDIDTVKHLGPRQHYVYCVSGQRAATAASYLGRKGMNVTLIRDGGVNELRKIINTKQINPKTKQ